MNKAIEDGFTDYLQNRDISVLIFHQRVLEEAENCSIPLWERLCFLKIFTQNIEEFYKTRVGCIINKNKEKNDNYDKILMSISNIVRCLIKRRDNIYAELEKSLEYYGIKRVYPTNLNSAEKDKLLKCFKEFILPHISISKLDVNAPFPHIPSGEPFLLVSFMEEEKMSFAFVLFSKLIPPLISFPNQHSYCIAEDFLLWCIDNVFKCRKVLNKGIFIATRSADLPFCKEGYPENINPEIFIQNALDCRQKLPLIRLQSYKKTSQDIIDFLCDKLSIDKTQVFISKAPIRYSYLDELKKHIPDNVIKKITYRTFLPRQSCEISICGKLLPQILKRDLLLHYPYESMEPFLQLIREAALDEHVCSIQITIYRTAKYSRLLEYFMLAGEQGKDVTVFVELRARFEEKNNMLWSERLKNAGCKVVYPTSAEKLHAKLCLITRKYTGGLQYITQIGTGNYNEITAKQYTDLCLITSNPDIGADAARFFENLKEGRNCQKYKTLLVSPCSLRSNLLEAIDRQIAQGKGGRLLFQMNSLSDKKMIDKLIEAAYAGVEVRLIVRGICRLLPGILQKTEGITITSIVGRFLEHTRIYAFGRELDDMKVYIGSADLMSRNLDRRIEALVPIFSRGLKERILKILEIKTKDQVKARQKVADGRLVPILRSGPIYIDSQESFMAIAKKKSEIYTAKTFKYKDETVTLYGDIF